MRRLILFLMIVASGCASLRTTETVAPAPPLSARELADPAPLPPPETAGRLASVPAPTPSVKPAPAAPAEPSRPAPAKDLVPSPPKAARQQTQKTEVRPRKAPVPDHNVSDHKLLGLVELAARNDEKIMTVFVGMYQKTVKSIMGDQQNPYKRQTINGSDGKIYEVLFYLTREPRKGKPISDRMLTPVIFRQGKVVAIGAYKLKKLLSTGSPNREKPARTISSAS